MFNPSWQPYCFLPPFILQVQPNSYCTFYDDQRQNWSMMFDSEKALTDFCKEVSNARKLSVTLKEEHKSFDRNTKCLVHLCIIWCLPLVEQ